MNATELLIEFVDLMVKVFALVIGGTWALYKFKEYREFKNWIQLDLDAKIYKLGRPEHVSGRTWDKQGKAVDRPISTHTHVVEVALKFGNKGKTRARLFNIQIGINTMRPPDQAKFDQDDGHLHLTRILTSGNLVPIFRVGDKPMEETSFYYVEPGVEQTITHLVLITEPRELVQVFATFSLEQQRLFPERTVGPKGLYPHTAAKTFPLPPKPDERAA